MQTTQTQKYIVKANGKETKPFSTFEEAKTFALAWKGQFSIFHELNIYGNGELMEVI